MSNVSCYSESRSQASTELPATEATGASSLGAIAGAVFGGVIFLLGLTDIMSVVSSGGQPPTNPKPQKPKITKKPKNFDK